jgi:hypothetical protein
MEDEGDIFLWNISWLSVEYIVLYPRRQNFSKSLQYFISKQEVLNDQSYI